MKLDIRLIVVTVVLLLWVMGMAVMAAAWEEQNTRRLIAETALERCEENLKEEGEAESARLVIEGA